MKTLLAGLTTALVAISFHPCTTEASEPWQSQGPAGTFFHSLAQAPDGSIYAGTVSGLYRYGVSSGRWSPVPLDRIGVGLVFVSSEGLVFKQLYSEGCIATYEHLVSFDGGQSWSEDEGLPSWPRIAAFAESLDGTVWGVTSQGEFFRRGPGASRWMTHPPIDSAAAVFDIAATPDGSLLVLASVSEPAGSAVFLSDDNGESWSMTLRTDARLNVLAADRSGYAVVGGWEDQADRAVFFSSARSGRDWSERPCSSAACSELISVDRLAILRNRTVVAAGRAPSRVSSHLLVSDLFMEDWRLAARFSETPSDLLTDQSGALWAVGMGYAQRSTDNAAYFSSASNGLVNTSVTSLVESERTILAVVGSYGMGGYAGFWTLPGTAGVHYSLDEGATWYPTSVWQANQVTGSLSEGLLAATDLGVQRSIDHGRSWWMIPGTEGIAVRAVAEDSFGTLCVISGLELICSDDPVVGWHGDQVLVNTDNALVATPDGDFLAEVSGVVHRSADGGRTWATTPLAEDIGQFAVSPDGIVYAPVANTDRVAVSEDSGRNWTFIQTPAHNPLSIAFHPGRGLLVGFSNAVFYSDNRFETWRRIDLPARSLLVTGDRLVAGSERQGVWLADLPSGVRQPSGRVGR